MKTKSIYFALTAIIAGFIYRLTLCPTVEFIDSGELAMACKNLGIAHPTGYPLYTMLGRLASFFPGSLIIDVNMMSLIFTALGAGFLFLLISELSGEFRGLSNWAKDFIAAMIALTAAFSPIWWAQGVTNEVYSLNLMLIPCSLWLLFFGIRKSEFRFILISLYLLGLCLANHLSAIYLVPGYIYLLFSFYRKQKSAKYSLLWMTGIFIFPISLYLFLPIRASFKPFLNWGGVNDLYFLYKHISGWQYRVWMFDKPLAIFDFSDKVLPALKLILHQFGWPGVILIIFGLAGTIAKNRRLAVFIIITFILNLIYVLNYEIGDIESYYLPLIIALSIFAAFGFINIYIYLQTKFKNDFNVLDGLIILVAVLPLFNLVMNFEDVDCSRKTFARQGVIDIANSMPGGGVALVENWDFVSPWLYMHFEENYRTDVVMLDKELMRRSWYIDFIKRKFPEIYNRSKTEFEEFLRQVEPFERNRPYNPQVIDRAYYGMLLAVIGNESRVGQAYTNIIDDRNLLLRYPIVPEGVLFRFASQEEYRAIPRHKFNEGLWGDSRIKRDKRVAYLLSFYERAFDARSRYEKQFGHVDDSAYYGDLRSRVDRIIRERDLGL
jgi:hypothetical protein